MRKLVVLTFVSLDGVMQAPGGKGEDPSGGFKFEGWTHPYFDDAAGEAMAKQMAGPFDLLLGRKTYDIFSGYWPEHQAEWPASAQAKKYVVSHHKVTSKWDTTVPIYDSVVESIGKLKGESGPSLHVYGSSVLVQTLLNNDLVDELWLKTFPVTLGKGKRLFAEGTIPTAWKLIKTSVTPSSVIFASYRRDGEVKVGSFT